MTLLEKLREKLGPELMGQVEDAVGDDFDWDFVPRSRLNKVIGQRNALATKVQTLSNSSAADEDDDEGNTAGATNTGTKGKESGISEQDVENLKNQHSQELKKLAKRYAVLDYLRAQGARDPKLVMNMVDFEKIEIDDKEQVTGLDDQITPLKESHDYLFQTESSSVPGGTGKNAGSGEEGETDPFEAVVASYSNK